jgi:hypothetical protein
VTVVQHNAVGTTGGGSTSHAPPAFSPTTVAGHMLIAWLTKANDAVVSVTAGWTVASVGPAAGTAERVVIAYKVAAGADSPPTFTWSGSSPAVAGHLEEDDLAATGQPDAFGADPSNSGNVTSRSSGTAGAATATGFAVAAWALGSAVTGRAYTNSFTELDATVTTGGTIRAGYAATGVVTAATAAESRLSWTSGANTARAAIAVFRRTGAAAATTGARLRTADRVRAGDTTGRTDSVRVGASVRGAATDTTGRAGTVRARVALRARAGAGGARSAATNLRAATRIRPATSKGAIASPRLRVGARQAAAVLQQHALLIRLRVVPRPTLRLPDACEPFIVGESEVGGPHEVGCTGTGPFAGHGGGARAAVPVRARASHTAAHTARAVVRTVPRARTSAATARQVMAQFSVAAVLRSAVATAHAAAARVRVTVSQRVATGTAFFITTAARLRVAVRDRANDAKGASTATRIPAITRPRVAVTGARKPQVARIPVAPRARPSTAAGHQANARIGVRARTGVSVLSIPARLIGAVLRLVDRWRASGIRGETVHIPTQSATRVTFYADGRTSVTSTADGRTTVTVAADGRTTAREPL